MRIDLIYPNRPPLPDAISEHVEITYKALGGCGHEMRWLDEATHSVKSSSESIYKSVSSVLPEAAVLHYNPFSWGHWGLSQQITRAWRMYGTLYPQVARVLFVHEAWTLHPSWQHALMRQWQQRLACSIANCSDSVVFSCLLWQKMVDLKLPGLKSAIGPVGSNIAVVDSSRSNTRERLGVDRDTVLLTFFGTLHPSRCYEWVAKAVQEAASRYEKVKLLYIGSNIAQAASLVRPSQFIGTGRVDASEASRLIKAADLFLCPYSDGASLRRGSLLAALAHGVPCISTKSAFTDIELLATEEGLYLSEAIAEDFIRLSVDTCGVISAGHQLAQVSNRLRQLSSSPPVVETLQAISRAFESKLY